MSKLLTRDAFLKPAERRYVEVTLPSGDTARIRSWTEKERSVFESKGTRKDGTPDPKMQRTVRPRAIIRSLCDEHGELILTEKDIDAVQGLGSRATGMIFDAIASLVGWSSEDIEDMAGNSDTAPADALLSD